MVCQSLSSRCCNYDIVRDDNQVKFSLANSPNGIVIDQPGVYKVIKDINWEAAKPTALSSTGSSGITGAAITITASDVTLDFCGHTIKQINGNVATFVGGISSTVLTVSSVTSGTLVPGLYLTGSSGPIGSSTIVSTSLTIYPTLNSTGTVSPSQTISLGTIFYAWSVMTCISAPNPVNNLKIVGAGTIRDFSSRAINLNNPSTDSATVKNVAEIDGLHIIQCNQINVFYNEVVFCNRFCDNLFIRNCVITQFLSGIGVSIGDSNNVYIDNVHVSKMVRGLGMEVYADRVFTQLGKYTNNVIVKNCSIVDGTMFADASTANQVGLGLYAIRNFLIENCLISNLSAYGPGSFLDGIHVSGTNQIGRGVNGVFRNVTVSNIFSDPSYLNGAQLCGIVLWESIQNILFDNCIVNDLVFTGDNSTASNSGGVFGFQLGYLTDNTSPGNEDNYNIVYKNCKVSNLLNKKTGTNGRRAAGFRIAARGQQSYRESDKGLRNVTFDNCIVQKVQSDLGLGCGIFIDGQAFAQTGGGVAAFDAVLQNLIVKDCNLSAAISGNANVIGDSGNSAGVMIAGVARDVLVCGTVLNDNDNGLIISNVLSQNYKTVPFNVTVKNCTASYNKLSGFNNQNSANLIVSNTYSFFENSALFNGANANYVGMPAGTPIRDWVVGGFPVATGAGSSDNLDRHV